MDSVEPAVLAAFERWTAEFPVYRDRLVATQRPGLFGALQRRWEPDADFRIEHHVRSILLSSDAGPGDGPDHAPASASAPASLNRLVARLVATPFDPARPPWVAYHVAFASDGAHADAGDAVVICCHHAFTDGVGAVRSFLQLTHPSPTAAPPPTPWHAHDVPPRDGGVRERAAAALAAVRACRMLAFAWALVVLAVVMWVHVLVSAADLARIGAKYARVWLHRRAFRAPSARAIGKQYAATRLASLDDVKAVAHARGATVNDVVLAVLAGALRTHLTQASSPARGLGGARARAVGEVGCIVPVSLRHDDDWAPGNHVTVCVVQLPAWAPDPLQRLDLVHRRLDRIKHSFEIPVTHLVLQMLVRLPAVLVRPVAMFFKTRFDVLVTNVPGPPASIDFAGRPVQEFTGIVPQPCPGGLGMAVVSYDGSITLSVVCDDGGLLPTPAAFLQRCVDEFHILERAVAAVPAR